MFRFANIDLLWLLMLIPVFVAAYIALTVRKRRQLRELGESRLVSRLMPDASHTRPALKFSLMLVAFALLIIAAARPQFGQKEETVKRQGIEVIIALDISNSMLAEDVAPSRLDRAKQMLSKMIDQMVNDKIGLVVFAGESYIQLPITCDYVSAKTFLNSITPALIQTQGTAIGKAIQTSITAFGAPESEAGRAIVIITDGENHEDEADHMAKKAYEMGIQVNVIGIGKPEGQPIPIPGTGNYMKDRAGNVVVSRLNEDMCRSIAKEGHGIYVRCDNTNSAMNALEKQLDQLAKTDIQTTTFTDYNEQYQSFALIALLLLVIEFFILARQNRTITRLNIFGENKLRHLTLLALFITPLALNLSPLHAQREAPQIRRGNHDYRNQDFTEAEVNYRRALERNDSSFVAHYNLGNALMRQDKYGDAAKAYADALDDYRKDHLTDSIALAHTFHNMGNALFGTQNYGPAVEAYKEALRLNPSDNDTRYNLVKALEMLKEQQQQQQNQQNKDQQQQNQDQQQQQQQQEQQQQEQQQQEQQQEQQQQEQQDPQQIDKETAEQILQALEQNEQETQEKVNLQRQQGQKRRVEKNW